MSAQKECTMSAESEALEKPLTRAARAGRSEGGVQTRTHVIEYK